MVTPLLLVPVINRADLLAELIASIDRPVRLAVIDNSPDGSMRAVTPPEALYVPAPWNYGVGASWNLAPRIAPDDPYWLLANGDTRLGPGDLDAIMTAAADYWLVGMNGDWRIMAWTAACAATVGLWDENLHPAFNEDADMEYRCRLAGVRYGFIQGGATHVGSAAIRSDPGYARRNAATHASNNAYYAAKWGGHVRGGERYTTPFDRGGSVADWTLDPRRVRDNRW